MSATNSFVWLTGTVTVPVDLPSPLKEDGLRKFYENPNDSAWGRELCRVLYHESIHFWQLLSSGYLANVLAGEWASLEEYEKSGQLSLNRAALPLDQNGDGDSFTVRELVECWARYWDVHTRSPATLVEEDELESAGAPLRMTSGAVDGYTSFAFDLFMQEGKDARFYAKPYRWALTQCRGNSSLVNILFPVVVFHAMGSRDPVAFFQAALRNAIESPVLAENDFRRTGNINVDWINWRSAVVGEAVEPARRELGMPAFTPGWDVIARGPLARHPILAPYVQRIQGFFRWAGTVTPAVHPDGSIDTLWQYSAVDQLAKDPIVAFMFPGDPIYRKELGRWVAPPRVRFRNTTLYEETFIGARITKKFAELQAQHPSYDATFEQAYDALDPRISRFRAAEHAVSLGLPADAFEESSRLA